MADNSVYITGAADGAFVDALNGLPPWATEATAEQIEKYLRKSFDIQSKIFAELRNASRGSGSGTGAVNNQPKKVADELDKLARGLKRQNEEDAKRKKREKAKDTQEDESIGRGKKLKNTADKVDYVLGGIAAVGKTVIGVNEKYLNVYDSLYKSGINVLNGNNSTADGFEALNQMVNMTGMRLETMQKVLEKYSAAVNVVGVSKFSKAVAMSTTKLNELGYYNEDLSDLIGTLIESEKGYMDIRGKSSKEISDDAIRLGAQLDRLSKTVGMSREQLQENLKANSKSTETLLVSAKYGTEAARKLSLATAGIKDNELRQTIMELAASSNDMQVEGFKKLQAAGLGDIGAQLSAFSKSLIGLDPTEAQKRLRSFSDQIQNQSGRIASLSNTLDGVGRAGATMVNSLLQQGRDVSDATVPQTDNAQKTQASLSALNQQLERTKAITEAAFFPMVSQVNSVTGALKLFNDAIYKGIGAIDATTRSMIGAGLIIVGFVASLFLARSGLNTFASLFGAKGDIVAKSAETMISGLRNISGGLGSVAGNLALLAGAAYAGYEAGTWLYNNWLKDNKTFQSGADALSRKWDSILSFFGNDEAKHRLDVQKKLEEEEKSWKTSKSAVTTPTKEAAAKKAEISVPKTPAPSTINSPSATPATPSASADKSTPKAPDTSPANGTGIEKPGKSADINSLLGYQASIMEQVLQTSTALLSVNKDILRYTRAHA